MIYETLPCITNTILTEGLIHYGSNKFDPNKFIPIKNQGWVKPMGGLWTSPVKSDYGWKDWCTIEEFRECDINNSFTVYLKEDSKILIIDSYDDLSKIPTIELSGNYFDKLLPDFEKLSLMYDTIWLTTNGQYKTRNTKPLNLYGWDCESVLILNPNCIS
jgi:hypothetical protein